MNDQSTYTCNECTYLSISENRQCEALSCETTKRYICSKHNTQLYPSYDSNNSPINIQPCSECMCERNIKPEENKPEELSHEDLVPIGSVWKHYKGNIYVVIGYATDCDTYATLILYRSPYDSEVTWARKLSDFQSYADENKYPYLPQLKRFKYIGPSIGSEEVQKILNLLK